MDKTPACKECGGRGPVPRWENTERGDRIPLPFVACSACGLDWPTEPAYAVPPPLPSVSLVVTTEPLMLVVA